jgi:NTE family protein
MDKQEQDRSALAERLAGLSLFAGCERDALMGMAQRGSWITLPAGRILIEQGAPSDTLYVVLSGRLAVVHGLESANERRLSELGPGETVGEMGVVTRARRSASVVALRDSELLLIERDDFMPFLEKNPQAMVTLFQRLSQRVARMSEAQERARRVRTLALLPLDSGADWRGLAGQLREQAAEMGVRCVLFTEDDEGLTSEALFAAEESNDLVLFLAPAALTPWRNLCLRQADRLLFLAEGRQGGEQAIALPPHLKHDKRRADLLILEEAEATRPAAASGWHAALQQVDWVHRLRRGRKDDQERLIRLLLDKAVCLVLSGGGARGFAHIGVIRALREAGVPLDLLAGASMGAMVAAGAACEWDDQEMERTFAEVFLKRRPTGDLTVPIVALLRGRRVTRLLQEFFGGIRAEDLWRPFYSVATDLTNGEALMQRRGLLWRNLRASVAIPGLLPPVAEEGRFLADGGVLNNLPVDYALSPRLGSIISVDIAHDPTFGVAHPKLDLEQPFWRQWRLVRDKQAPGIVSLLLRAGTISSAKATSLHREAVDLWLSPPQQEIGLLDWRAFERSVELGYRHALEKLQDWKPPRIGSA